LHWSQPQIDLEQVPLDVRVVSQLLIRRAKSA